MGLELHSVQRGPLCIFQELLLLLLLLVSKDDSSLRKLWLSPDKVIERPTSDSMIWTAILFVAGTHHLIPRKVVMGLSPLFRALNELFTTIPLPLSQALEVLLVNLWSVLAIHEVMSGYRNIVLLENLIYLPSVPEQFLKDTMAQKFLPMIPSRWFAWADTFWHTR
jgi:hypothetical protein